MAERGVSLFTRLFLLILLTALPPLVGLGAYILSIGEGELREATDALFRSNVATVNQAVQGELERVQEELSGVGLLLLAPGLGEDSVRVALASNKVASSSLFDSVTLYGPGGVRAFTLNAKEARPLEMPATLEPGLLEALATRRQVFRDVRAGAQGPVMDYFTPVKVQGEVRGYLATQVKLGRLCELMQQLGSHLGSNGDVFVVDGQRRLVLHADTARVLARESRQGQGLFQTVGNMSFSVESLGTSREFSEAGVEMFGTLQPLPELGWAVVVQRPRAEAHKALAKLSSAFLAGLAWAALAALVAGGLGARQLTRPLRALVAATQALAERTFRGVEESVTRRRDELGTLGRAFDSMAVTLESKEREVIAQTEVRAALSRYLSPDVVDLVVSNPGQLRLGGERREVTILFADVVGFTRLSETQPPEVIVALLNELFTFATEIIQRSGGIIDKFIGDCIMAVWGTPQSRPDDALRAVQAAEQLRRWLEVGNRRWRERWGIEIQLAIGIHTGPAVAGNVGSEKRMEYTVIGDTVNVAARIESMAQAGQILVSEATRERIAESAVELVPAGERKLHGRAATTLIFEVPA
jgi:class 3 adenylate cyclase